MIESVDGRYSIEDVGALGRYDAYASPMTFLKPHSR